MLVRQVRRIRAPHRAVESVLAGLGSEVSGVAEGAYRRGEAFRQRLEATPGLPAKDVLMSVGTARIRSDGAAFPVTWRATGPTSIFPKMEADVVVAPEGDDCSLVVFEGSYDPPFGMIGSAADRLGLNRVAELTVASWFDGFVDLVERMWTDSQREADLDHRAPAGDAADGQFAVESIDSGLEIPDAQPALDGGGIESDAVVGDGGDHPIGEHVDVDGDHGSSGVSQGIGGGLPHDVGEIVGDVGTGEILGVHRKAHGGLVGP